jgi:hypothetical protein
MARDDGVPLGLVYQKVVYHIGVSSLISKNLWVMDEGYV